MLVGDNKLGIVLGPDSGIDIAGLRSYCSPESCIREDSQITYQSHYDPRIGVSVSKAEVKNPELSNLKYAGGTSTNLLYKTGERKFESELRVDVTSLSDEEIIELSSQKLPRLVIEGFSSQDEIDRLRSHSERIFVIFRGYYDYLENEGKLFEEMNNFLLKYKKIIKPASVTETYLLNIFVPLKDNSQNELRFVVDPKEIDWEAAMTEELKILLSKDLLRGISQEDIGEIGKEAKDPGSFLYYNPLDCGDSQLDSVGSNNASKSGWLSAGGNCDIEVFDNGVCPKIQCYKCGGASYSKKLPKAPLILKKEN